MARKSTGKRLRFEVFKRDHFTCQYCGAQPPDVMLVCDHIDPCILGGKTQIDNLITSCEACNQGKADKPLSAVGIRPDADVLYLGTQQEIAELRRYQESLAAKEAAYSQFIETLQGHWCERTGFDWAPAERILRTMLDRHPCDIVHDALMVCANKARAGKLRTEYGVKWVGYLYAVARNMDSERNEDLDDGEAEDAEAGILHERIAG